MCGSDAYTSLNGENTPEIVMNVFDSITPSVLLFQSVLYHSVVQNTYVIEHMTTVYGDIVHYYATVAFSSLSPSSVDGTSPRSDWPE